MSCINRVSSVNNSFVNSSNGLATVNATEQGDTALQRYQTAEENNNNDKSFWFKALGLLSLVGVAAFTFWPKSSSKTNTISKNNNTINHVISSSSPLYKGAYNAIYKLEGKHLLRIPLKNSKHETINHSEILHDISLKIKNGEISHQQNHTNFPSLLLPHATLSINHKGEDIHVEILPHGHNQKVNHIWSNCFQDITKKPNNPNEQSAGLTQLSNELNSAINKHQHEEKSCHIKSFWESMHKTKDDQYQEIFKSRYHDLMNKYSDHLDMLLKMDDKHLKMVKDDLAKGQKAGYCFDFSHSGNILLDMSHPTSSIQICDIEKRIGSSSNTWADFSSALIGMYSRSGIDLPISFDPHHPKYNAIMQKYENVKTKLSNIS